MGDSPGLAVSKGRARPTQPLVKTLAVLALLLALVPSVSFGAGKNHGMVFVKGGCFEMGCGHWTDGCDHDENPVHRVCVNDFYINSHEVTVREFREFVRDTGYKTDAERGGGCSYWTGSRWASDRLTDWRQPGFEQTEEHPVVCVSWNDAAEYIRWRSMKEGLKYRFPTEAEWEYAARSGGKELKYGWDGGPPTDNIADESAKKAFPSWNVWAGYDDGYVYTAPVAAFSPNGLGIYDMPGNVIEWCADWYDKGYYAESPSDDPGGPSNGKARVVRGAAWNYEPKVIRLSNRNKYAPGFSHTALGFRLAR